MPANRPLVIAGQLRRQYLLPPEGPPLLDAPGGNLLYAAAGAQVWNENGQETIGLLARIGEDYPQEWLKNFKKAGFDTQGIKILPESLDLRSFLVYTSTHTYQSANPVSHFARLGLTFPKSLLGYQPPEEKQDSRARQNPDSPRLLDIPEDYKQPRAVHLCPLDFATHMQFAAAFRQFGANILTIDPNPGYMNGNFLVDLRSLLQGLTAFLPSEEEIRSLFWGRTSDLWEMAAILGGFGCQAILIKRGGRGQYLYETATGRRWEIPAYPGNPADITGAGDAFCGGFLHGYAKTLSFLQASLHGNIAASLDIEGSGPFYIFDAMPGLAQARLLSLSEITKEIT
ncbi:MAG: carbohydrate kinase family protein [Anaerolineales bacterium]|jgi:sugar/nucleoside kinase (ribokinase family)|nr:carbohydrate kinase family protein [Anaerolineales bacterium]